MCLRIAALLCALERAATEALKSSATPEFGVIESRHLKAGMMLAKFYTLPQLMELPEGIPVYFQFLEQFVDSDLFKLCDDA